MWDTEDRIILKEWLLLIKTLFSRDGEVAHW